VRPVSGLSVTPFHPNSGAVVIPRNTAPPARSRFTDGASVEHGASNVVRLPYRIGGPFTHTMSLIVVGTPSIGESGAPARQRAVESLAIARAASSSMSENGLNCD
jgi:hypothetical protein